MRPPPVLHISFSWKYSPYQDALKRIGLSENLTYYAVSASLLLQVTEYANALQTGAVLACPACLLMWADSEVKGTRHENPLTTSA
jgi:hypothetical protein